MEPYKRYTKQTAQEICLFPLFPALIRSLLFFLIPLGIYTEASAQLCAGSLGDPVVHITFDAGANPGPSSSAMGTGYQFITADCPNDGQYTIRNSTSNCWSNTWHTLGSDHTGNPQGYFMLVNASFQPSDFYVDTVRNLCANTTYEFAAWLLNMVRSPGSIMPNITFSIELPGGTVLQKVNTGNIPITSAPQWKQYGFWFSTPPGVQTLVLRITNNAAGGIGNDLALDDITFRPCGPEIEVDIAGNNDSINICEDAIETYTLAATQMSGYTAPSYQWQISRNSGSTWNDIPGATDLTLNVTPSGLGNFQYRLTVAERENAALQLCRIASNPLVIGVHPLPEVEAGPDRMLIKGATSVLAGTVKGSGLTHTWTPNLYLSDPGSLAPKVTAIEDVLYTLTAESPYGCTNKDVAWVKVANELYVPNAFTPNNDGINDTWRIPFLDPFLEAKVSVYSRYGQRVYYNQGTIVSWDGTYQNQALAAGVYVYVIDLTKEKRILNGIVTIVR